MIQVDYRTDGAFLRRLRRIAILEATTLVTLLFVAVPLKYLTGWPLGVRALGPLHGLAFLSYVWMLIQGAGAGLFRQGGALSLFVSGFIPFAGFITARRLSRHIDAASRVGSNG